jgi:hypothetical protein
MGCTSVQGASEGGCWNRLACAAVLLFWKREHPLFIIIASNGHQQCQDEQSAEWVGSCFQGKKRERKHKMEKEGIVSGPRPGQQPGAYGVTRDRFCRGPQGWLGDSFVCRRGFRGQEESACACTLIYPTDFHLKSGRTGR